jgi:hypothetical protein
MARKPVERQNTSWRISVEAKRLLERMAERSAISQAAVLEQAIREKARREKIALDGEPATPATGRSACREAAATPEEREAARERFRQLVEKARAGFADLTPEEIEGEVALAVAEVRQNRRAGHG